MADIGVVSGIKRDKLGRRNQGWSHINTIRAHQARVEKVQVHVMVDSEEYESLRRFAVANDQSIAEVIRTFITWGLEQEG